MPWMMRWAGGFPVFAREASGARIVDVDGHEYVDLCLGDTGAMPGHGPARWSRRLRAQLARGITTMLPTEDAVWVGEELTPPLRPRPLAVHADRHRRQPDGAADRPPAHRAPVVLGLLLLLPRLRRRAFAVAGADGVHPRPRGQRRPAGRSRATTRAIEFNDLAALEAALADGLVACVLAEPAMTNMGIILPEPATTTRCAS